MTPRRTPETELEPRSAKETFAEIGVMTGALVVVAATVVALSISAFGPDSVLEWLSAAGKVLYGQLGWTFGLYVAVLIGFYAVSTGGQLIEGSAPTARLRWTLGALAELLAASTVPVVLIVGVYCWFDFSVSAVFLVLVPVLGIIFFLAGQLGAFVVGDKDTQIAEAVSAMDWLRVRLAALSRRSSKPFLLVWAVNAMAIAVIAALISVPGIAFREVLAFAGLHFVIAVVLLGVNAWCLYSQRVSSDPLAWFVWLFPGLLYVVMILAGVVVATNGTTHALVPVGIFFTLAATLATTFWPRKRAARFVLDWSIQGAATAGAAKSLDKKYANVMQTYVDLMPKPGWRVRLVTFLTRR